MVISQVTVKSSGRVHICYSYGSELLGEIQWRIGAYTKLGITDGGTSMGGIWVVGVIRTCLLSPIILLFPTFLIHCALLLAIFLIQ